MRRNIILVFSLILLFISVGIFGYLKYENSNLNNEVNELKEKKVKVQEKIDTSKEQKQEKENEYQKLQEEVKEKVEELKIWKNLEEKLNTALS